MHYIGNGVWLTAKGAIIHPDHRSRLAPILGINDGGSPISVPKEVMAAAMRYEGGMCTYCMEGQLIGGAEDPGDNRALLSRDAMAVVTDCDNFRILYRWIMEV